MRSSRHCWPLYFRPISGQPGKVPPPASLPSNLNRNQANFNLYQPSNGQFMLDQIGTSGTHRRISLRPVADHLTVACQARWIVSGSLSRTSEVGIWEGRLSLFIEGAYALDAVRVDY